MIIENKITVKNRKFYKDLGYQSQDEYIEINIKDLSIGSHILIRAICDYCNAEKKISYKDYNKNISSGGKFSCSIKCGSLKSKESNLIKYGVESTNSLSSTKEKSRSSIIKKYGVDHISKSTHIRDKKSKSMKLKSEEVSIRVKNYWSNISEVELEKINDKKKNTIFDRYEVSNISQIDNIKSRVKETFINKYGGYTYESDSLMNKVISTNLEKYGHTYSIHNIDIKDKIIKTNLYRYGYIYPSQSDEIKMKTSKSNLEQYGVNNIMLSEEFRSRFNISMDPCYIKYLGNRLYEFKCENHDHVYIIDYDNYIKRKSRNSEVCTICFPISENSSIKECELRDFISDIYKGEIINNYRDGIEIDIYLPSLKIGLEFNGLHWHSEIYKTKNYHLDKTNFFDKRGIRIIHIWEDDWDSKKVIIKSQIKNLIGVVDKKIFARKCEIREINDTCKDFLNNNHIQGYIRSTIKIGLYHDNMLVSLMTFDNLEGRKKMDQNQWNLSRFCSLINTSVVGGGSKILKYFIKKYNPMRIISFADLDWSKGFLYEKLGFKMISKLNPDYKYVVKNMRVNKQRFTKKKLVKMGHDINISESKIMRDLNINRIYGCGQLKYELIIQCSEV